MEGSAGWTDFLVAAAGATGALVGLVFIGLSINLALLRFVLYQAATTPLLVAGLSLRHDIANGMLWFAVGVLLSLIVSLFNAWVLLIEILR